MPKALLTIVLCLGFIKIQCQNIESYVQEINNGTIKIHMQAIPGGSYLMANPKTSKNVKSANSGQVLVQLDPFWMAATEITHDQFMAYRFEEKDLNPIPDAVSRPTAQYIDLTWGMGKEGGYPANSMQPYTALSYCKWLWKKTGIFYRLPTEAEWEYAAKEAKSQVWPKGLTAATAKDYAWYKINAKAAYQKVASKKPNALGLYDMLGNVAEWCLDMYAEDYFEQLAKNPKNFYVKRDYYRAFHTARGGSFKSTFTELNPSLRQGQTEEWNRRDPQIPRSKWWLTDGDFVGFRIVRPAVQPSPEAVEQFFKEMLEVE